MNNQKLDEVAGNLCKELEEMKCFDRQNEDMEPYGSITVGCTTFFTIVCC